MTGNCGASRRFKFPRMAQGYKSLFKDDVGDDEWLEFVGKRGWVAISKDYKMHRESAVVSAIRDQWVRMFHLRGSHPPSGRRCDAQSAPFVRRITKAGKIEAVTITYVPMRTRTRANSWSDPFVSNCGLRLASRELLRQRVIHVRPVFGALKHFAPRGDRELECLSLPVLLHRERLGRVRAVGQL